MARQDIHQGCRMQAASIGLSPSSPNFAKIHQMVRRGRTNLDELGERLKLTREALGLAQVDLCRRTGISTQAWNNYERGAKRISVDNAIRLRERLGIPLDW